MMNVDWTQSSHFDHFHRGHFYRVAFKCGRYMMAHDLGGDTDDIMEIEIHPGTWATEASWTQTENLGRKSVEEWLLTYQRLQLAAGLVPQDLYVECLDETHTEYEKCPVEWQA